MPDQNTVSRVLTLVFTDLADSTALKSRHGDSAVDALLTRHRGHIARLASECSGRVIVWAGDGCFLTFEISSAAVIFALRLQQTHTEEPDLPAVRVGIHLGEVTEKSGANGKLPSVDGLAVDLASRVCGLARPGQVLMSSAVYNSARQRLGAEEFGQPVLWQTHGSYQLKGFDDPLDIGEAGLKSLGPVEAPATGDKAKLVRRANQVQDQPEPKWGGPTSGRRLPALAWVALFALALSSLAYFAWRSKTPSAAPASGAGPIKSLAVLPLENLSKDPEQEYFADGMTEALTSELAKIKSVKVISRTSVMKYKGTKLSMPEIAAELGVEGLIEGSVQKYGDEVRINAQLIHGLTDSHRWSQSYTNSMTNVLRLQSDVALAIAAAMKAELSGEERARIAESRAINPNAYDAYLLGTHFREQITPEGIRTAIRYFEEATRLDPRFVEAWVMQADAYSVMTGFGLAPPAEAYPKARELYLKALEIDTELLEAHNGLAYVEFAYYWEWEQAEQRFIHVLARDPRFARGHLFYGMYLLAMGRRSEAANHAETQLDLAPDDPLNLSAAAYTLGNAGETARALAVSEKLLADHPDFLPAFSLLAQIHLDLGDREKALAALEQGAKLSGRNTDWLLWFAEGLGGAGQADRARAILAEALGKGGYTDAGVAAMACASLGELDEAFVWMEKCVAAREFSFINFRTFAYRKARLNNPAIAKFRSDPRFWQILEPLKLPPLPADHPGYAEEQRWIAQIKTSVDASAAVK